MTERRYVVLPGLGCRSAGNTYWLEHEKLGLRMRVGARIAHALDPFLEPAPLSAYVGKGKQAQRDLAMLLEARVLVPEEEAEEWDEGPLSAPRSSDAVGVARTLADLALRGTQKGEATPRFAVIGAPSEQGSHAASGAQYGPMLIRQRFQRFGPWSGDRAGARLLDVDSRRVYELCEGLGTMDLGDIRCVPGESLARFGERLEFVVQTITKQNLVPITLGGDHAISLFPIRALLRRYPALGILHFDAHHDHYLDPRAAGPHSHASVFALAMREQGIEQLFQIGLRTMDRIPAGHVPRTDPRIRFVTAREAARQTPEQIFAHLPKDLPFYLSFDVDCMAPHLVRETGTRELGGLDYYQGLELIQHAARHLHIVGADFVEVARYDGRENLAAEIVARYLLELLIARLSQSSLTTYLYASPPLT